MTAPRSGSVRPGVSLPASYATAARDAGISLSAALRVGVAQLLREAGHAVPPEPPPTQTAAAVEAAGRRRREAPAK